MVKKLTDEEILKIFERALRISLTPVKVENPRGGELTVSIEHMKLLPILFEWMLNQKVKENGEA